MNKNAMSAEEFDTLYADLKKIHGALINGLVRIGESELGRVIRQIGEKRMTGKTYMRVV